ncbi:MAG: SpaH/EbpB family LPXTG-anchored major pilin [Clostridia bacterium]|nr:SpaH/EbpB family LPXTG-anchored major pilin [Clostridia bacterium]
MKTKNRIYSALLAGMLMLSSAGITVTADDTASEYDATNAYVLDVYGDYTGSKWQYFSPYYPAFTYDTVSDETSCVAFTLYNTITGGVYPAYCIDIDTGLVTNKHEVFRRLNLEDSTYASAGAGVVRSIMKKGFPNTRVDDLAVAAGVEGLTVGEAVAATQAAVWQAAHGGLLTFTDFVSYVDPDWSPAHTAYYDECNAEIKNGYAENEENEELIESHIETVFNYLTSLAPSAPNGVSVSARSFKSWEDPIYSQNEDGTYDISVEATIDVEMVENDSLTLSAVLGDGTYFGSAPLQNGSKEYTVTIENVPANALNSDITLAIDGIQTVSDVFLFDAEGNRTTVQSLVAYCEDQQLPVHAEVVVEAERVLHVYKYAPTGDDPAGTGEKTPVADNKYPLEGISFTIYKVPSSVDISGETPTDEELSTIQVDTNYVATITTDADGYASFSFTRNGFDDGVYLIVEEEDRRIAQPAAPFYVYIPMTSVDGDELLYQVYVYPKNDVVGGIDIEKDVIELGNALASVPADAPFTWIISATIPVDIADGKEYVITDELDTKLDYVGNVTVNVEKAEGVDGKAPEVLATLVEKTDYTLTLNGLNDENVNDSFAIALTPAGMQKVADAVGLNNVNCRIRVYFDTSLSDKAGVEDLIPNGAVIMFKSSFDQVYEDTSDKPEVYTGFALIDKYDSVNKDMKLAGAEFAVYREATKEEIAEEANEEEIAEETTEEEIAEEANKDKFNTTLIEGKTLIRVSFYTDKKFEDLKLVDSVTTDEKGSAVIAGLADGTYYLVETKAPAGYNMLTTPIEFTIDAVQEPGAEVEIAFQECELDVENSHGSVLPSTGGIGTTIFYCAGAVLAVGAFVLLITKKRMSKEV